MPVHRLLCARDARVLEYGRARQLKGGGGARAQAEMDRRHRDTTQLRRGRIDRLKQLCEEGGGGARLAIDAQPTSAPTEACGT